MANITESDEVVEMFCEICDRKGKRNVIAVGFCVACVTYYCDTCLDYHAQFLPDHIQQDRNQMPKDFYLEKCEQHSNELVKFYCQSCENSACSVCKNTFHKTCQRVCHLSKLACQFELEEEFHIVEESLNSVEKEADTSIEMMRVNMKQNIKHAKAALLEQKKVILTLFDDFEKEISKHENDFKSDVEKEMKKLVQIKKNIQIMKSDINNKKLSAERCKLFLATKAAKRQIKHIKECLNAAKPFVESTNVTKYIYEPTKKEIGPGDLGKVTISNQHLFQTPVPSPETSSFINADEQLSLFRDSSASSEKQSSTHTADSSIRGKQHSSDSVSTETLMTQIDSDRIEIKNLLKKKQRKISNREYHAPKTQPPQNETTSTQKPPLIECIPLQNSNKQYLKPPTAKDFRAPTLHRMSELDQLVRIEKKQTNVKKNILDDLNFFLLLPVLILLFVDLENWIPGREKSFELQFEPKCIGHFSTDHLFILDNKNFYILNLLHHQLKQLPLKYAMPSGVATLDDNMLTMVFPSGQIRFVEVSAFENENLKLEYIRTLVVGNNCTDLVYAKSRLLVLCSDENRIENLDIDGNFLPSWPLDKKIFNPSKIAVSPVYNFIYISDTESDVVFRLTMKGILKASYKHKRLLGPSGMTFDTAGNIYVAGFHSHNVFKINANLTEGREYFNKKHGLYYPSIIAYDKFEKTLYVGSLGSKTIRVLKIDEVNIS